MSIQSACQQSPPRSFSRLAQCHTPEIDGREILERPVFCFTSDIDWASEAAIESMLELFDQYGIVLTPFITHDSPALRHHYEAPQLRERVGLHPNFLSASTHG